MCAWGVQEVPEPDPLSLFSEEGLVRRSTGTSLGLREDPHTEYCWRCTSSEDQGVRFRQGRLTPEVQWTGRGVQVSDPECTSDRNPIPKDWSEEEEDTVLGSRPSTRTTACTDRPFDLRSHGIDVSFETFFLRGSKRGFPLPPPFLVEERFF